MIDPWTNPVLSSASFDASFPTDNNSSIKEVRHDPIYHIPLIHLGCIVFLSEIYDLQYQRLLSGQIVMLQLFSLYRDIRKFPT